MGGNDLTRSARKAALRRQLRAARAARPDAERAAVAAALARLAVPLVTEREARTVAAYVSVGGEPGTGPLRAALADAGVRVLLPLLRPDGSLDWAVDTGEVAAGPRGVPQPSGPALGPDAACGAELLLVPALAVDRHGHRLGRGGGSYDRALTLAAQVPALAVVHDDEVVADVPVEGHDRPVAGALTPSRVVWWR